ncbi:ATP synthase subunit s, mitochondrial isoform X2 [Pieris brassicae]|uniref:ATP synthase subunit s, mitochondrial isoform X2 n=1 Tax=Pieris brassicae TaxID=7116 RepID=UPI001E6605B3|nr:ATP synthase subunit s, mitochondrial isoform X2 [Pieris brassicae]
MLGLQKKVPPWITRQNIHKTPIRKFWEYVNMMFNKPDLERIKTLGPDRACAEWVLRNGGKVIWADGGCTQLWKIILHNNKYVDDRAMQALEHGKNSLTNIQVSQCINVTDVGLKDLSVLTKLQTLILFNLSSVDNIEECIKQLRLSLPKCKIIDAEEKLQN